MKKGMFLFVFLSTASFIFCQTALDAPLPDKFKGLKNALIVSHFPAIVDASEDADEKKAYQWKHTTSVMSTQSAIQITECGAYIFYNQQWNLRVSMTTKDFSKLFDCKKGKMKKGQPYTFKDNWRHDNQLRSGWAIWYFIGINEAGETVYGVGKLEMTNELVSS